MKHTLVVDDETMSVHEEAHGSHAHPHSKSMRSFPLLALSLLAFALMRFLDGDREQPWYSARVFQLGQLSGDTWQIDGRDVFLTFSLCMLFFELLRATRTGTDSITNHGLSALVFIAALVLFVLHPGYGNSTFFLFVAMTFIDFVAGFVITTVCARRDTMISRH